LGWRRNLVSKQIVSRRHRSHRPSPCTLRRFCPVCHRLKASRSQPRSMPAVCPRTVASSCCARSQCGWGFLHWWNMIQAAMRAQSLNALGQAYLLVGKDHVLRLDAPESPRPIALDDHRRAKEELPAMARSLVDGAGREVERVFFADPADPYEACLPPVSLG